MWTARTGLAVLLTLGVAVTPAFAGISDQLLPDETEMVVGVNVRGLLDSEAIKKNVLDDIKQQLKDSPASEVLAQFGLDPLKDIDSVIIAIGAIKFDAEAGGQPKGSGGTLMILKGKFDQMKIETALEEMRKKSADAVKRHEHAKVTIYETKQNGEPMFAAFLDKERILAGNKKEYLAEAIDKQQGTKKTKLKNKDVAAALTRADEKQTIWMAMTMPDTVKELLKNAPQGAELADKLEAMTLAVTVKDGVYLVMDWHCVDKDGTEAVKKLLEQVKGGIALLAAGNQEWGPTMTDVLNGTRVSSKDKVVSIRMEMDKDLTGKFFKAMKDLQPKP